MNKIDNSIKFTSINIGLVTISDSRNEDNDKSGNLLKDKINNFGHKVYKKIIIKDDLDLIKKTISDLTNDTKIDAIITTGGTGLTGRDNKNVVGIDEVGRGPLAGPVISCAVIFYDHEMNNDSFKLINDSKKLSKINRIKIFKLIY